MDTRQLQYFVAIVRTGSFSAAARACFVTQPAISSALRKLEDELGVPLLERHPRRVEPTEFGRSLYKSALTVDADLRQARENIEALRRPDQGRVRVGVDQTIAPRVVTDVVRDLHARYSGLRVQLTTGLAARFATTILEGELDFIVAQLPPAEARSAELSYEPLYTEAVFPVADCGHPLAAAKEPDAGEFGRSRWCGLRWIGGRILWIREFFAAVGGEAPEPVVTGNALTVIRELLPGTDLLALFPERLVAADLADGRLVRIGGAAHALETTRCLITRRNRHHSAAAQAFLDRLEAACRST